MSEPNAVAVIGLGLMGAAFSERLQAAGLSVRGYDIDAARAKELEARGGYAAADPADAARGAACVLLALWSADDSRAALLGPAGALATLSPGGLVLDCGTVHPDQAAALGADVQARGFAFVDAAIAGSSVQTRDGSAVALAGGDARALAKAQPVLRHLVRGVHALGPAGSGARAKLVVNLALGLNRLALAEALVFAERQGMDGARMLAVLKDSPAYSAAMDAKGEKMLKRDYAVQAKLDQHRKDVGLILEVARGCGAALPLSALHEQLLRAASARGLGERDNCAVIEALRALSAPPL